MKNCIYSFLYGFSFFVTKLVYFNNPTADIMNKPFSWMLYFTLPLLICFFHNNFFRD